MKLPLGTVALTGVSALTDDLAVNYEAAVVALGGSAGHIICKMISASCQQDYHFTNDVSV
jgi:hypothetical protein